MVGERPNCWQVHECGRELGGAFAADLGICPASTERRLDGIHGGENAGRACWAVAGTLCSGSPEGIHARENDCVTCAFYEHVIAEEMPDFVFTPALARLLTSGSATEGDAPPSG